MIQASDLEIRPDEKGPKNLAILLLFSSLIVAGMGWQDWQLHNDGLSDEQIETFLATPNSQPGEPTTVEQYRDFEADVRENSGYLLRGVSLMLASVCLLVGARSRRGRTARGRRRLAGGVLMCWREARRMGGVVRWREAPTWYLKTGENIELTTP